MAEMTKKSQTDVSHLKSSDFLGLGDTKKYPKYVKLYNFYTKKYVFLNPGNIMQEIDIYQSDHDYNTFYY